MSENALELRGVHVAYGADAVLQGIDLVLAQGECHALLGESGSGKSTLLRAVAGFERLRAGSIQLRGRVFDDARAWSPPEMRRVGMVFQDYALFPHLNVGANVTFGRRNMPDAERDALLARAGLAGYAARDVSALSGGEQQRVALCRALAQEPQLILFDEPFSNLNRELRRSLRALTLQLLRERGITALFVTHDAEEAFALADRISVLHGGALLQTGTPRELYETPSSLIVARSVGEVIVLPAEAVAPGRARSALGEVPVRIQQPGATTLVLRLEQLRVAAGGSGTAARVIARRWLGATEELELELAGEVRLQARAPAGALPAGASHVQLQVQSSGWLLR